MRLPDRFLLRGLGLLAMAVSSALAQHAAPDCVEMRVLDPDGLPIAGAIVTDGSVRERTSLEGESRLCGRGEAGIEVRAKGFAVARVQPADAARGPIEVRLRIKGRVETPVVVTGTAQPVELAELDRSLTVLSVRDPSVPAWSFADVLKRDSSVHLRERGPDGTQADLSIRGSTFDQVLVMINGMRVSDSQTGHHTMDLPLPFEGVQQVEILHGSGATLYGSDATGGTINFVTRKPEASELRLMSGVGEHGWNRMGAAGGLRRGIWSQSFAAARDFSSGFAPGREFQNASLSSETFFDTTKGSTRVLAAVNDRPFGANGFYGPFNSWEQTGTKLITASQSLGRDDDGLLHRFRFGFRRHKDDFVLCREGCVFGGTQFAPDDFHNIHRLNAYQGSYDVGGSLGSRFRWSGGTQLISEGIDSTVAGQRRRERASAYVMLNLKPTARLSVSAGVREEIWTKWRGQTSPTASVGYWVGGGFKVRGQLASGFRIPTYTDLYHRDPGNVGNPELKPETAWNFEFGGDWYGPRGMKASATVFRRLENNTIDWIKDAGSSVFQARNFQDFDFRGAEFSVRRNWGGRAEVWADYSLLRASGRIPVDAISRYVFNYPRNQGSIGYRGTFGDLLIKTQIGAYNRLWQSTRALWDVSIGRSSGRWRPFLQATNLANTSHQAFQGLVQPGRWVRGGVQIEVLGER